MRKVILSWMIGIGFFSFNSQATAPCAGEKGGWLTNCLMDNAQLKDEEATRVYWDLRKRITAMSSNGIAVAYSIQLNTLLKRNELDYIKYSESFCNMNMMIAEAETELDKILSCQIRSAQIRIDELREIEAAVIRKEGAR